MKMKKVMKIESLDPKNDLELGGYTQINNGTFIRNVNDFYRWHAKIIKGNIELHKDAILKNGRHRVVKYCEGSHKEKNRIFNRQNKI